MKTKSEGVLRDDGVFAKICLTSYHFKSGFACSSILAITPETIGVAEEVPFIVAV